MHLLVSCASLIFSLANCSSRSYKSRDGGGRSFIVGGNTAAWSAGIGVSNCGGIRVNGSCLTPIVLYSSRVSGIKSVSNLYNFSLKRVVKSFGSSSDSYKHDLSLSARAVISGTWWYSLIDSGSLVFWTKFSNAPSSLTNHWKTAS